MTDSAWRIGITDFITAPADIEQKAFPEAELVFLKDWREGEKALAEWGDMDALLAWHLPISAELIPHLKKCRIVVRYGVGYDTVDVKALTAADIPFANTPDYGTEEVADTACAMIMNIVRKISLYDRIARGFKGTWQENTLKPHTRSSELTLGVIGVGRIGTAVINRMKPFRFRIIGYDPYQPSGHEKAVGYTRVQELDSLLQQSDIVTLHCPLTQETEGMIDESFYKKMKPKAALVNTSRGKVMNCLDDLEQALRKNTLSMACLDVLPDEPPREHPLLQEWRNDAKWLNGRLIINPHCAYYSEQGWYEMRYKASETARLFLRNGKLRNQILPE